MKKIILLGIIPMFLLIPYLLDKYLMGKIVTTMGQSEWFGFLGSYLGGGIGAIITLIGIYWQLNETNKKNEKENKEGVFEYLKYNLEKNRNIKFKYEVLKDLKPMFELRKENVFFSLSNSFIEENAKIIFSENKGKEIAGLFEDINYYNNEYIKHIEEYTEIENKIEKLTKILTESNLIEKDKFIEIILKVKSIILALNIQASYIQLYLDSVTKDQSSSIEEIYLILKREVVELMTLIGNIEITDEKINSDLDNLISLEILAEKTISDMEYEKYLIKLFEFERKIFILPMIIVCKNFKDGEFNFKILKEQKEIYEYYNKKIEFLTEKNKIIERINKLIYEIQSILTKLNK